MRAALDWAFSEGGDAAIGVALTAVAAPIWMGLSLHEEGRTRLEQALAVVRAQGDHDPPREMQLLSALGTALLLSIGTTSKAEEAWSRALEIAETVGDTDYQRRALWGLYVNRYSSGNYSLALALAERFHRVAAESDHPTDSAIGDRIVGVSLHILGDQVRAHRSIERALASYPRKQNFHDLMRFQFDQRVASYTFQARISWLQGFPEQALRTSQIGLDTARALEHPLSLFFVLIQRACPVALLAGDLVAADHSITALLELSHQHAVAAWKLWGTCYELAAPFVRAVRERGHGRTSSVSCWERRQQTPTAP